MCRGECYSLFLSFYCVDKGDPKASFSIATTPRCRAGRYSLFLSFYSVPGSLVWWAECLPMVRDSWVQSQFASYQSLKKWYLILNTQQYKICIKGKVEQSRERSSASHVVAIEKGAICSSMTTVANFYLYCIRKSDLFSRNKVFEGIV